MAQLHHYVNGIGAYPEPLLDCRQRRDEDLHRHRPECRGHDQDEEQADRYRPGRSCRVHATSLNTADDPSCSSISGQTLPCWPPRLEPASPRDRPRSSDRHGRAAPRLRAAIALQRLRCGRRKVFAEPIVHGFANVSIPDPARTATTALFWTLATSGTRVRAHHRGPPAITSPGAGTATTRPHVAYADHVGEEGLSKRSTKLPIMDTGPIPGHSRLVNTSPRPSNAAVVVSHDSLRVTFPAACGAHYLR